MRNITLTFLYMEREHIGKDVSCVPYYLGKALEYNVTIVSLTSETNGDVPDFYSGIQYRKLFHRGTRKCGWYKLAFFWWYLIRHARNIDILVRFHYSVPTMFETILYKLCNPKGKVYVKCDANAKILDRFPFPRTMLQKVKCVFFREGMRCIDVISCETTKVYNLLRYSDSPYFDFKDKLVLVANGFDEDMMCSMNIATRKFEEKENIMITVGRLGSHDKNTEMLIEALSQVDMRGWIFYLIGPIEEPLHKQLEQFFEKFPEKKNSVIFLGAVFDKNILWQFYNRAKVFVFTSRHESYGLVLNEAKRFANYVVSTDVGAAKDIISDSYGELIPQEDPTSLVESLQHIIDGKTNIDVYADYNSQELSWENSLSPVIEKLKSVTL